jgi:hypothetical protein
MLVRKKRSDGVAIRILTQMAILCRFSEQPSQAAIFSPHLLIRREDGAKSVIGS